MSWPPVDVERRPGNDDALSVETGEPEAVTSRGSLHGIWIALATFVPTFLAIVFGIPYLAGLPMASRFPAGLHGSLAPVVSSLAPAGAVAFNADAGDSGTCRSRGDHSGHLAPYVATGAPSSRGQGR
jgi:hypothetical protein